jgi:tetrahydromethanopterin S-methyltransferase subunit B
MLGYMEKYRTALDMRIYDKSSHGTFSFMSPANAVSERFILLDSLIRRIKSVTELKLNSQDYLTAMGGLYSGLNAFDDSNKVFWMASILQNSSWHSKYLASGVYLALFIFLSIIIILTVHKWERRNF